MSRHQANRRRNYGRRQHELHERDEQPREWLAGPEPEPDWSHLERSHIERAPVDDLRPMPLGDLLGHHRWRWVAGRG
ncbi:MAG TPA: hypothetical protein VMH24_04660 [Candidatus Sulfotelmatobacter sp.]|nr:hypothetical protein [Candidatus Sulfotelmatobacter sp.]